MSGNQCADFGGTNLGASLCSMPSGPYEGLITYRDGRVAEIRRTDGGNTVFAGPDGTGDITIADLGRAAIALTRTTTPCSNRFGPRPESPKRTRRLSATCSGSIGPWSSSSGFKGRVSSTNSSGGFGTASDRIRRTARRAAAVGVRLPHP
jgi:hypothetical protein